MSLVAWAYVELIDFEAWYFESPYTAVEALALAWLARLVALALTPLANEVALALAPLANEVALAPAPLANEDALAEYTLAALVYDRYFCFARSASCSRVPLGSTIPCSRRNSRSCDSSHASNASALRPENTCWAFAYCSAVHPEACATADDDDADASLPNQEA